MISYLREIPAGELLTEDHRKPWPRYAVISQHAWESIDTYNGTLPTAPSAGRVYRRTARDEHGRHIGQGKDSRASGPGNTCDTLYIVMDAPADDPKGGQLHYPFEALVVME